jgi:hypothetical protein
MRPSMIGRVILVALACLVFLPLVASAQSSIVGLVRDESGGVLPGVSVEVASPALIEKVRAGVTDAQGRYRIVDLRPGTYSVTFSLTGFSTVVREGQVLPSDFTLTVNGDMKVGSLQETVTVSGAAPVVDVQQASKTQVLGRDLMDTLPTTRHIFSVGILVPGVRLATPDVGGSAMMGQTGLRSHGINERNVTQLADGMMINSEENNGQSLCYYDDALGQETTVMTSALPADTLAGGTRMNIIPKDGGNVVSGSVFLGGTAGQWQSSNVTDALRKRNIATTGQTQHIQNFNGAMGGPIVLDRIWFFMSARHTSVDSSIANVPTSVTLPDGTVLRSIQDQFVRDAALRLTWQINSKNKLAAMYERIWKYLGKSFGYGTDPRAASQRDARRALFGPGQAKWTSTVSSKLLLETGYSTYIVHYTQWGQPETLFPRFSPQWYALAQRTDTALNTNFYPLCAYVTGCTTWGQATNDQRIDQRHVVQSTLSYVTGTHNIKFGVQDTFGKDDRFQDQPADLVQVYVNNKPSTVTVYNTPIIGYNRVKYDIGVFAQDSWTIKRLTLNPGLRIGWFNSGTLDTTMGVGRFAPARFFAAQPDLPKWGPDYSPRLSVAYDLFGDGRTAIKANYSKYYAPWTGNFVLFYANAVQTTDSRSWFDADLVPGTATISGAALATNNDGIAQDNEIGPSSSTTFGIRSDRNPAAGIQNFFNWETTASVQHQLMSGVSVTAAYYRRTYHELHITDRGQITNADYASFTLPMPSFSNDATLSGILDPNEVITVYNLNSAKRSVYSASQVDYNSTGAFGGLADSSVYNGFEFSFSARLPKGSLTGGMTTERNVSRFCDTNDDPNGSTMSDLFQNDTVARGGRFCDQNQFSMPWRQEYKLSGSYMLPYSVSVGMVWQGYPGSVRAVTWAPAASLFPGGSRTNAETILLTKPGTSYQPRFNQVDINFKKNFRSGRKEFSVQIDLFNALNSSSITATNNAIGSSLGNVTTVLLARMPRLAFQMRW